MNIFCAVGPKKWRRTVRWCCWFWCWCCCGYGMKTVIYCMLSATAMQNITIKIFRILLECAGKQHHWKSRISYEMKVRKRRRLWSWAELSFFPHLGKLMSSKWRARWPKERLNYIWLRMLDFVHYWNFCMAWCV